jgi:hypothetical protein
VNPDRGRVAFLSHLPTLSISGRKATVGSAADRQLACAEIQLDSGGTVRRHHNPGLTEYTWFSKLKGGARRSGFFEWITRSPRRGSSRASLRAGIRTPSGTRACPITQW